MNFVAASAFLAAGALTAACTAFPATPMSSRPALPASIPTEIAAWGQSVDNARGVIFTVLAPQWTENYDGRAVLQVVVVAANNSAVELTGVGAQEFVTERGAAARAAGPPGRSPEQSSVLPGETASKVYHVSVPAAARTLRVTIAQGASRSVAQSSPAVNLHFRGDVPTAGALEVPEEDGDSAAEGAPQELESLCSDRSWRAASGAAGNRLCGADWDGSAPQQVPFPVPEPTPVPVPYYQPTPVPYPVPEAPTPSYDLPEPPTYEAPETSNSDVSDPPPYDAPDPPSSELEGSPTYEEQQEPSVQAPEDTTGESSESGES